MTTTQGEVKLIMLNPDSQPKRDKTHSPTTPQQCGTTFMWPQLKAGPNNMTVLILVAILPSSQHSLNAVHI